MRRVQHSTAVQGAREVKSRHKLILSAIVKGAVQERPGKRNSLERKMKQAWYIPRRGGKASQVVITACAKGQGNGQAWLIETLVRNMTHLETCSNWVSGSAKSLLSWDHLTGVPNPVLIKGNQHGVRFEMNTLQDPGSGGLARRARFPGPSSAQLFCLRPGFM